jgi:hypothetical protein
VSLDRSYIQNSAYSAISTTRLVVGLKLRECSRKAVALAKQCVVPKGVLHNPVADNECGSILIETISTKHTGDVIVPQAKSIAEHMR